MPIIMIAFILIIVLVFPVILFPKLSFILAPAKAVLWVIDFIAELVASIPYAQVIVYSGIAILLAYLLYFIVCRFVMAGKIKWWVSVALTVILSVTLLIENLPLYRNENAIYFCAVCTN